MDFTIETVTQAIDRLIIKQSIKSARQSAIAICYESRCLDWLYLNKVSPFRVRRYREKRLEFADVDEQGYPKSKLTSEQITVKYMDGNMLCTSKREVNTKREEGKSVIKTVFVLDSYDLMDTECRNKLKKQTLNKLIAWHKKKGKV